MKVNEVMVFSGICFFLGLLVGTIQFGLPGALVGLGYGYVSLAIIIHYVKRQDSYVKDRNERRLKKE